MPLPTYDKSKRRKSFEALPKGAYVCRIIGAKETQWKSGNGSSLEIGFDIAEGEYAGFFDKQYQAMDPENKKWPNDGIFRLTVPTDGCASYVWDNYNSFFADLEESNNGYVFDGDPKNLKGKLIGGKFHIEQTEYNGNIYDHTRFRWSCVADDVRNGKPGRMPNDKLITATSRAAAPGITSATDFMTIPEGSEPEIPF